MVHKAGSNEITFRLIEFINYYHETRLYLCFEYALWFHTYIIFTTTSTRLLLSLYDGRMMESKMAEVRGLL